MRMLALGLAAAALAIPVSSANAIEECNGVNHVQVCVSYECRDHHCIQKSPTAVYTDCRHPMPAACEQYVSLKLIGTR